MTTWTHSPNEVASEWKSLFHGDLISPYGDFSESTDLTSFWDDSLDSVTIQNLDSSSPVSIDSGSLKILGNANADQSHYIKAISVVNGATYTIAGTTTAASAHTLSLKGGSTSAGSEYFSLLITASGLPTTFADESSVGGSLTFTTTTDTFYLYINLVANISAYISINDISLIGPTPNVSIDATWNTLWGGIWNIVSLVAWEDLDKHNWEDWN